MLFFLSENNVSIIAEMFIIMLESGLTYVLLSLGMFEKLIMKF
jgi:hypothetical protein